MKSEKLKYGQVYFVKPGRYFYEFYEDVGYEGCCLTVADNIKVDYDGTFSIPKEFALWLKERGIEGISYDEENDMYH